MESLVGRRLGDYELVERIGGDATGSLYKAFQFSLERLVAIRVLDPSLVKDSAFLEHYRQAVLASASLVHPHIARLHDLRSEADLIYTVSDFAEGGSLRDRLQRGPLPAEEALEMAASLADALSYAHERGVVHGGLDPEHVRFDAAGHPLIADFGLALAAGKAGRQDLRPEYTAPEQAQGLGSGPQTDLYALGLVLFESLTGQPAFRGDTPLSVLYQQVNEPSPALASLGVRSAATQDALDIALAKSPERRFAGGSNMAEALREAAASLKAPTPAPAPAPKARPAPSVPPPPRRSAASWLARLLLGVVIVAAVASLAGLATGRIQTEEVTRLADSLLGRLSAGAIPTVPAASPPSATAIARSPTPSPSPPPGPTATSRAITRPTAATAASSPTLSSAGSDLTRTSTPSATATSVPASPTPTPAATPTATATATSTATPTATAEPSPTPTPTDKPTSTPTVVPTQTPSPTPALSPTETPTSEPTPEPTPTLPPPAPALGGRIAYPVHDPQTGRVGTWIAAADGSGAYQLAPCMRQPDFRSDGRLVMNGEGCGTDSLWVMSVDGSERWEVSRHPEDSHPSWSPDGGSVVYSSSQQGDGQWRLYTHAIGGEIPHAPPFLPLGNSGILGAAPVWLSAGEIAYNGCDYVFGTGGNCGLWVVDSQGGEPRRLTNHPDDLAGDELGGVLLFMSPAGGAWDVYRVQVDGSGLTQLTGGPGNSGLPTWSADGSAIAFLTDREGQWAVWTMRPDGSEQRKLFDLNASPGPRWTEERITWGP